MGASLIEGLIDPLTAFLLCAVHTYAQCGGEGGSCSGGNCKDAAWSNVACLSYDACTRINNWWWCVSFLTALCILAIRVDVMGMPHKLEKC